MNDSHFGLNNIMLFLNIWLVYVVLPKLRIILCRPYISFAIVHFTYYNTIKTEIFMSARIHSLAISANPGITSIGSIRPTDYI